MANINGTNGNFASVFDTYNLTPAGSPYPVTYSYCGDSNYSSIAPDTSQAVIVNQAIDISVGGEVRAVNRLSVMAPWLAAMVLLTGLGLLVTRRFLA